ncbi:MAG: phytoene/squalene synthase family protein [Acidobacteria bacterium]|nr:phytoene/squalene synthase family protein [Acidobacteriota bacterium]MCB9398816.1 phytoene/squalene synthase family protein [Acidobacteriota bacterium]
MNPDYWSYCEQMLPMVSRTFALNIRALRGDLHRAVLLAYLWCRILDTVEDAPKFPADQKVLLLEEFADQFGSEQCDETWLEHWIQQLSQLDGDPAELNLIQNAGKVAHCFNQLKAKDRLTIIPSVLCMAKGMAEFQKREGLGQTLFLTDEADLDQYCYYVAGTVGEMLTGLFLPRLSGQAERETLQQHAVSFGLALQITNITKDVMVDVGRGWSYVPLSILDRAGLSPEAFMKNECPEKNVTVVRLMAEKANGHLQDAFRYTMAIPRRNRRIRLFCLWPLWMAAQTMGMLCQPNFQHEIGVSPKITRREVRSILRFTSAWFWSNGTLRRDFQRRMSLG